MWYCVGTHYDHPLWSPGENVLSFTCQVCIIVTFSNVSNITKALTITHQLMLLCRTFDSYEFLASHTFGSAGKFVIEVSMIGFMMGTYVTGIKLISRDLTVF